MVTKERNETNINAFYNSNPLYRHGYVLRILCSVWTIVKYPPSILRVPVRRASGLSGEYNGTSWHFESTVRSAFVPDVRECHPLLRLPFGIGRFLLRENTELESSKSSLFDRMRLWQEWGRGRRIPPRTLSECKNIFPNIPSSDSWTFYLFDRTSRFLALTRSNFYSSLSSLSLRRWDV